MTVKEFLKLHSEYTIEDFKDFIEGLGNFEQIRYDMNKVTGFKHSNIDLFTLEGYSEKQLLEAKIIDDL